jgi:Fur family ferric uptake transcriptional regulator
MKRRSRQREIILEEVRRERCHPSAQEVYDRVRHRLPRISLGTVYRNLEQLADHGIIQKLELPGASRRYDGNVDEHCHIRCLVCGRVDDFAGLPWLQGPEYPIDLNGYKILGQRLEFFGICPRCREAAE